MNKISQWVSSVVSLGNHSTARDNNTEDNEHNETFGNQTNGNNTPDNDNGNTNNILQIISTYQPRGRKSRYNTNNRLTLAQYSQLIQQNSPIHEKLPPIVASEIVSFLCVPHKIGDVLDVFDRHLQKWYLAVVIDRDLITDNLKIHYIGWGTRRNEWVDMHCSRISAAFSHSGFPFSNESELYPIYLRTRFLSEQDRKHEQQFIEHTHFAHAKDKQTWIQLLQA